MMGRKSVGAKEPNSVAGGMGGGNGKEARLSLLLHTWNRGGNFFPAKRKIDQSH
jgi:hypothetical protein